MNKVQQREVTEQIWRELSSRLRQFVQSRIKSTADADDVLQSVFLNIHSKLDTLCKEDRIESWVFQITRNTIADHFRKKRAVQLDSETAIEDSDHTVPGNVTAELSECLVKMIDSLPGDQRRALSMYELEGLSQKDIANRVSISLSGTKSRIQRGRKSLKEMLKACCEFEFDGRGNIFEYEANDSDCCDGEC